ncbi:MAG: DUF2163 domain-containing protein [Emcibacter sp.]|nr:DUF2163 domain-containing protein [Emcibacter sp.]
MKTISLELKNHLSEVVTNMVTCWVLTRQDGVRMAFATHDKEIEFDNLIFSPANSFLPSSVSSTNSLNVDNLEINALLSSEGISDKDISSGLFDHAMISIFQINWQAPVQGKLHIRNGWLGEFILKDKYFTVEIRGLSQRLQQVIGDVFSPECRADLGGNNCHVNLEEFSVTGSVTEAFSRNNFRDITRSESDGWYDYGLVRWLKGSNAGLKSEVKNFSGGQFILFDNLPNIIMVGDSYQAVAGCDKRSATCGTKFQNFKNFKGETSIPGTDSLYYYPGLK